MAYIDWKLCCWLAASALCVVNKVLLFKHVCAWLFSFPPHTASESLALGTVQSEKQHRMLVLTPAVWSTVRSLVLMLLLSRGATQDGLPLLAAFLLTLLWAYCYFRTRSKMRSKQQNKFDVPAASGGKNIYCLTTRHLWYGWLDQWRHSAITKTGCSFPSGLKKCLCTHSPPLCATMVHQLKIFFSLQLISKAQLISVPSYI